MSSKCLVITVLETFAAPAAVSVSLRGKRRLSDVDVERARLLHEYALHRASADAQHLADLQCPRAALVEAQDALFTRPCFMPQRSSSALRSPSFLSAGDDFHETE